MSTEAFQMLNYIPMGIFVLNKSFDVIFWNNFMEDWTRMSEQQMIGENIFEHYPHLKKNRYKNRLEILLEGGPPVVFSSQFHRYVIPVKLENGEMQIQHTIVMQIPGRNSEPNIIFIIQDVTDYSRKIAEYREMRDKALEEVSERKKAEVRLARAKEEAERANRSKSIFLANMTHEIRTPMNAILGFCEILAGMTSNKRQKTYLNAIMSGGKTLLMLINDILDLSKIEAGKLELEYDVFDLHRMLGEIETTFSLKAETKGIDLEFEQDEKLPETIILDEARLRQVLLNLIGNALKFTETGYIRIRTEALFTPESQSSFELRISVKDTGTGIPEDQFETIFSPFEQREGQSHAKYGGTGLGLAICKDIIELMDGKIELESRLEQGSIFTISVPDVEIAAVHLPENDPYPSGFNPENIRFEEALILVADDVEVNRRVICDMLEPFRALRTIEAQNGKKAVELTEKHSPSLILMDLKMPVMDGFQATTAIKNNDKLKNIPVVAVTASAMHETRNKLKENSDGFIGKPVSRNELLKEIAKFIPHTCINAVEAGGTDKPEDSTASEDTAGLISELRKLMDKNFPAIEETMLMDEISVFASELLETGKGFQCKAVEKLGIKLKEEVESFDVDNIPETLKLFPGLIDKIILSSE